MLIVRTECRDVRRNLAVEEWLLDRADSMGPLLMLWRNDPAVVIGKNQNPWLEVRIDLLRPAGAVLARRGSGGGAVYHDPGNLNYSLIVARAQYDPIRQFSLVRRVLAALGVVSEVRNRTNLFHGDRKFSGNSFCLRGRGALHHGTLLVASNLAGMGRLLEPPPFAIETTAVRSAPAPVINLSEVVPGLDTDRVAAALEAAFEAEHGPCGRAGDAEIESWDWRPAAARHASKEWLFDATPRFVAHFSGPGGRRARLEVAGGRVERVELEPRSDAGAFLVGRRFDPGAVRSLLEGVS